MKLLRLQGKIAEIDSGKIQTQDDKLVEVKIQEVA